jgi:hypothetical protein
MYFVGRVFEAADNGVLWVGEVIFLGHREKEDLSS